MSNKITISITGKTGRTTISDLLTRFMLNEGFDVTQHQTEEFSSTFRDPAKVHQYTELIKEKSEITIIEQQAPRAPRTTFK